MSVPTKCIQKMAFKQVEYQPWIRWDNVTDPDISHNVEINHKLLCHGSNIYLFYFIFLSRGKGQYMNFGRNGPPARYIKLRVAHAPGMPGTFFPTPRVSNHDMHHDTCETHVPWYTPGSLTSGFLWTRSRGKRSRHSWRMHNPQFYVSGKRPISWPHWHALLHIQWNR